MEEKEELGESSKLEAKMQQKLPAVPSGSAGGPDPQQWLSTAVAWQGGSLQGM